MKVSSITEAISEQKISHVTDGHAYYSWFLSAAKQQDKPRIIWCYKIKVLLLVSGGGAGNSHMKGAGMLIVLLRGVKFGFWSHLLGCSGQNVIILSRKGLF